MSKLISCHKPPVNGNICEKFVAINQGPRVITFEWSDYAGGFVFSGTDISISYDELAKSYDLFVWDSEL